jgi:hypothetical protein
MMGETEHQRVALPGPRDGPLGKAGGNLAFCRSGYRAPACSGTVLVSGAKKT